jgi:hypothetical protein
MHRDACNMYISNTEVKFAAWYGKSMRWALALCILKKLEERCNVYVINVIVTFI